MFHVLFSKHVDKKIIVFCDSGVFVSGFFCFFGGGGGRGAGGGWRLEG